MAAISTICFIACHAGPAEHFQAFANALEMKGHTVEIYASGPAVGKFSDRQVNPFAIENNAELLATKCSKANVVITDVGHSFNEDFHQRMQAYPDVKRFAYYDNPEGVVPGEYGEIAKRVRSAAGQVLYANTGLAKGDRDIGIGYYPLQKAEVLLAKRKSERTAIRKKLGIEEEEKLLVYVGGNNSVYFEKAFPAFLQFLKKGECSGKRVMVQQHPGAKEENRDGKQLEGWEGETQVFMSEVSTDEALIAADAVLYYQTSMAPLFVLAGIPTMQVGHEPYQDILFRKGLLAKDVDELFHQGAVDEASVRKGLGLQEDWQERLAKAIASGD